MSWAEVYIRKKWRLHPSSRLATIDMNRKLGAMLILGGDATPSNTMSPGPRFTSVPSGILIYPAVWSQQTWDKNWGLCPFWGGGAGSLSNNIAWAEAYLCTKWHLHPSNRLATIHQHYKETDMTDDNSPVAYSKLTKPLLVTVAQKY